MNENLVLTTGMFEEAEKYWLNHLAGELMEPDFLSDYSRTGQYVKDSFTLSFEKQVANELIRISKNNNFLLNVILLTVFKILVYKFTGQNDIIVSSLVLKTSNQNFNKCIALKDFLSPGMTFKDLLLEVKETAADGYKYQYYPIRKLVELLKLGNGLCLFKFVFLLDNIHEKEFIVDITDNFENDIIFSVNKNEGLEGEIIYNSKLFKEETIKRLADGYIRILTKVLSDTNIRLSDINTISADEKKKVLFDFNNTRVEYPKDKTLHQLFDQQVKQKSEHIVIVEIDHLRPKGTRCISYGELSERVSRLVIQLGNSGAAPGSIISLMIGHSIDLVVGILSILKAGCVYLPLDPDYPGYRINYMFKDSGSSILLISGDLADKCEGIDFEGKIIELSDGGIGGMEIAVGNKNELKSGMLESLTAPYDPAYVIYTSGSTGKPKGVIVEHRNVVRLVKNTNYIDFSGEDRMLPTGAIAFDISTFEIWGPLLNGVKLYMVDEYVILDAERLGKVITENEITILHLIPQLFSQTAAQKIEIFAGLKYLLVGGDVVSPRYINEVRNRYKNIKILQMYGPTENTTFTTSFLIDKNYEVKIPIGKPVGNTTVYILDRFYNLQPVGIVGELCTGGDGIARGYLNIPGLTAEKFVSVSFVPGARLYKTGDLARWRPDGNIEFLGRVDQQIKVRGFRIELSEIENRLLEHEEIKEAVVLAKEDKTGDKYLTAYIVPARELNEVNVKEYLFSVLPVYMVPSYFVRLQRIPLNPNGKVDRKSLPYPQMKSSNEYIAPRNQIEEKLVEIWGDVLGVNSSSIGIDDNFFEIGGHSLKATLLVSKMHKELDVRVPVAEIFKAPTSRGLAQYIKSVGKSQYISIQPLEKKEYYALSSAQHRIYIQQQLDLESTAYNITQMAVLDGELGLQRFTESIEKLLKRHESFRTSFIFVEDEPMQKIHNHRDITFESEYYALYAEAAENSGDYHSLLINHPSVRQFVRSFDLTCAPLLRAGLITLEEKKHLLMVDMHHITADGVSNFIIVTDFMKLYEEKDLPPLRLQYRDFSKWQNQLVKSGAIKMQETYWLERFKGDIAVLEIPTDYPPDPVQGFEGEMLESEIGKNLSAELNALAAQHGATLYMVLLAICTILLSKYSSQDDIIIGSPIAGRPHADLENIVGMFINVLLMRNLPVPTKSFEEFLSEVKENAIQAFENQDYQFDELVKHLDVKVDSGRNPLYDVIFALENMEQAPREMHNLALNPFRYRVGTAKTSLRFGAVETKDTIVIKLTYSTALFKRETAEKMLKHYLAILKQVKENSDIKLKDIKISLDLALIKANSIREDESEFGF